MFLFFLPRKPTQHEKKKHCSLEINEPLDYTGISARQQILILKLHFPQKI